MSSAPKPEPQPFVGVDDIVAPQIPIPAEAQSDALNALEAANLSNEALRQLIKGRGDWGTRIFWIMVSWLGAVIAAVALQGFGWHFHLSDSVIIAFITTTTVNVIGLGYIVAKYFFAAKD